MRDFMDEQRGAASCGGPAAFRPRPSGIFQQWTALLSANENKPGCGGNLKRSSSNCIYILHKSK
jgi:hypothetical protein